MGTTYIQTAERLAAYCANHIGFMNFTAGTTAGSQQSSLTLNHGPTVTEELVADGILEFEVFVAVTVKLPVLPKNTCCVSVPFTSGAGRGRKADTSVDVRSIVSPEAVATMWKFGSTALMVTSTTPPAAKLTGSGVPTLPVGVFGAFVSPGSRTCN